MFRREPLGGEPRPSPRLERVAPVHHWEAGVLRVLVSFRERARPQRQPAHRPRLQRLGPARGRVRENHVRGVPVKERTRAQGRVVHERVQRRPRAREHTPTTTDD